MLCRGMYFYSFASDYIFNFCFHFLTFPFFIIFNFTSPPCQSFDRIATGKPDSRSKDTTASGESQRTAENRFLILDLRSSQTLEDTNKTEKRFHLEINRLIWRSNNKLFFADHTPRPTAIFNNLILLALC